MVVTLNYDYPILSDSVKFEELCRDLWAEEWKNSNVALHGRKGQAQLGVDVYGIDKSKDSDNKRYSGIQSKKRAGNLFQKQDLTEDELTKEVGDAQKFDEGELEQLIIATTLDDDVAYQALERKLTKASKFDVRIVGWQTISKLISKYPDIAQRYFPLPPSADDPQFQIFKTVAINSTNRQLTQAKELIDEGNSESALKILGKLEGDGAEVLSKEDQFKLYTNIAVAYSHQGGSNDKVMEYFEKAYALGVDKPASYHNMAAVHVYRGQLDKANEIVDEGLAKHKDFVSLKALKAKISFQQSGRAREAIDGHLQEAKKSAEFAYQLATIAAEAEMRTEAIDLLRQHKEKAERGHEIDDARLLALYGSLLVEQITSKNNYLLGHFGDEDIALVNEAKKVFDVVARIVAGKQIEKTFSDVFTRRSVLDQILGDKVAAIADAKKAYDLAPANPQVAGHYAMILMEEGKFQEAHKTLEIDDSDSHRLKLLDAIVYQREGAKEKHLELLKSLIDDRDSLTNHDRFVTYCAYIQALLEYGETQKAEEVVDQFEAAMGISAESLEFRAVLAAKDGDEQLALENLLKATSAINENTLRETVAGLGSRLYDNKKYTEAVTAFEKIITVNTYDSFLEKYIVSLWHDRQFERAEAICKEVIKKHGNKPLCVDILFNIAIEKNDLQKAVELLEGIAGELSANEYSIKLASLNAQMGDSRKAKEVLAKIDTDSLIDEELVGMAQVLMATDQALRAIELLYPAILASPNNPQLQMAYVSILLTTDVEIQNPTSVSEDTVVELTAIDGGQRRTLTIESDPKAEDLSRNHYHQGHPAAKLVIGKVKGDEVQLGQEDKYTIENILSKYIYLLHDLMNNFAERFPDIKFLQKVKVIEDDGKLNLTKMTEMLNQSAEQGEKITSLVENGKFPMALASKIYKKSFVDMYYAFIYDEARVIPSSALGDPALSGLPTVVILDLTACITLCESGASIPSIEDVRFVMPSSSLASTEEKIRELESPKTKDGYAVAYTDKGKFRLQERPKEVVDANKKILKNLLYWIKANVETIPLTKPDAMSKSQYEKFRAVIDKEGLDVMVEAEANDNPLVVSNDFALRRLMAAEQKGIRTINTQQLLKYLREQQKISSKEYLDHIKFLLKHGYKHTFIEVDDLMAVLRENNLSPNEDFDVLLLALQDERADIKPVIGVAAKFLYEYWKVQGSQLHWNEVLPKVIEALKKRSDYSRNGAFLEAVIERVFRILPQVVNEIIQAKKIIDSVT